MATGHNIEHMDTLPALPARPEHGHKGTFGRVLIIAGSRGMSGAACLSGMGALRGGAGLVFLAIPDVVAAIVAAYEPSYLTIPLPATGDGGIASTAMEVLESHLANAAAVAIGPGLGASNRPAHLVAEIVRRVRQPLVIDADALNAVAGDLSILRGRGADAGPRILTPHPGEFSRLTGIDTATIAAGPEQHAVTFAREHQVVLVLKGRGTIVTDGTQVAVNRTGNSGMATGGSGDVLTGLLAALLAQQMPPFDAAQLAVFLHGRAGDLAADELSQPGMIASDLPRFLPKAWHDVIDHRRGQKCD